MSVSGVRSSWLMLAKNACLASFRSASSLLLRACSSATSMPSKPVESVREMRLRKTEKTWLKGRRGLRPTIKTAFGVFDPSTRTGMTTARRTGSGQPRCMKPSDRLPRSLMKTGLRVCKTSTKGHTVDDAVSSVVAVECVPLSEDAEDADDRSGRSCDSAASTRQSTSSGAEG